MKGISQIVLWVIVILVIGIGVALYYSFQESTAPEEEKTEGDKLEKIRYGGQYYPGEFVLFGEPSFWSDRGVEVEHTLFSSGAENNEALVAGNLDINCGSDSKTVAIFNAIPNKALIIGILQRGDRYATVVREDSNYDSWNDLAGKKVATRFGTGAEGVLRKYYEREGYSWENFQYVNLKIEDMAAALESGQIEAFTAWEPTPGIVEAKGIGRVMRTYGDVALVPVSIHTTRKYAREHQEEIVRFLAAQLDKAELIRENPKEAAKIASTAAAKKGITVSSEAFEKVFSRIDFTIEFDQKIIDAINQTADFLVSQGKIQEKPELEWDTSFIEEAKKLRQE